MRGAPPHTRTILPHTRFPLTPTRPHPPHTHLLVRILRVQFIFSAMKSTASILAFACLGTATAAFSGASVVVTSEDVGESPGSIGADVTVGTALVATDKIVITYVLRQTCVMVKGWRGVLLLARSRAPPPRGCAPRPPTPPPPPPSRAHPLTPSSFL